MSEWNDALDAAAALLAKGYTWVRRPLDPSTMTHKIEVYPGNPTIKGDYVEATHVAPGSDGMDAAAVLSLRRKVKRS